MRLTVKFRPNFQQPIRRIERIPRLLLERADRIVVNNVSRKMVSLLKSSLRRGGIGTWKGESFTFNHLFKEVMLKNTKFEFAGAHLGGDTLTMSAEFGYFVHYGLNLEKGSPPHDPGMQRMIEWASNKLRRRRSYTAKDAKSFARNVRRKIMREGSNAYPLIIPIWELGQDQYVAEVHRMIAKVLK